ncbi:AAA family ATPase [Parvibaculum sp.]|uniref:ATP-dependent nuclease n=1 Tax=Parvibaculum sp. TaxID=2024848 RepID=UPI003298E2B3
MENVDQFTRVEFKNFKAFKAFAIDLRHFNILVGPNNAGKSTILAAFRILASGMRRARARKPTFVRGPLGAVRGYEVDLSSISVAEENIFYNYDDSESAHVVFKLSNRNTLTLYFPEQGVCYLLPETKSRPVTTPSGFRAQFNCQIGFVPILGPVEHHEQLYEEEAARLALFNYRAARNFRNIWYHRPEKFEDFREALRQTWPGMDILPPEVDTSHSKPRLHMYCPEQRVLRELFWAGFGFQVWCQMLTHLIQSRDVSMFLIDEPDIYLHSDLQRQLLGLLRNLGPDVLLATHSTEIISEAEADDILLVNKVRRSAKRIQDPSQLTEVFSALGSNMNPILTQLAKTRRAVFVEGKDFQILGKFARKLGEDGVGSRRDFAVVPVEGFNPERVRILKSGMETTLGAKILSAIVLDRDYRCEEECREIVTQCKKFCDYAVVHSCKEIENFLLVPTAIDRALSYRVGDKVRRTGVAAEFEPCTEGVLEEFSVLKKNYIQSQLIAERRRYGRESGTTLHESQLTESTLEAFERDWSNPSKKLNLIPGKDAIGFINRSAQASHGVSVTATAIVDAMKMEELPKNMRDLIGMLAEFSSAKPNT